MGSHSLCLSMKTCYREPCHATLVLYSCVTNSHSIYYNLDAQRYFKKRTCSSRRLILIVLGALRLWWTLHTHRLAVPYSAYLPTYYMHNTSSNGLTILLWTLGCQTRYDHNTKSNIFTQYTPRRKTNLARYRSKVRERRYADHRHGSYLSVPWGCATSYERSYPSKYH
jgi:hypothetical protein